MTIKVGDAVKVCVKHPKYGWGRVNRFSVGKVSTIEGKIARVDFPEHSYWKCVLNEIINSDIDEVSNVITTDY